MPENDFFGNGLGKESVPKTASVGEGAYFGVLGRVFRDTTKNGNGRTVAEFLLIEKSPADKQPAKLLNSSRKTDGTIALAIPKNKNSRPMIDGVVFAHSFFDIQPNASSGARYHQMKARQNFGNAFGAYDETEEVVDWNKIASYAGHAVSLNLVRDYKGKYIVLDLESDGAVTLIPGLKAERETVRSLYEEIYAERAKRAEEQATSVTPPAPEVDEPPF